MRPRRTHHILNLLIWFLLLLLSGSAPSTTDEQQQQKKQRQRSLPTLPSCGDPISKDVTVVGGGLAGIFAASVLEQQHNDNGMLSYQLLEATDKFGGRLQSFTSDKFTRDNGEQLVLEMGAQILYGKRKGRFAENPMWKLFSSYGFFTADIDYDDWSAFRPSGRPYRNKQVQRAQNKYKQALSVCLDVSGDEWFEEFLQGFQSDDESMEQILDNCQQYRPRNALDDAARYFYTETLEHALPADQISRAAFSETSYDAFGLERWGQFDQDGSSMLIEKLVEDNLDAHSIRLHARVTDIVYSSAPLGVTTTAVVTDDGEMCEQQYLSQYVIVAVPMNVLKGKEGVNQINFDPPLEDIERHPIDQNKVRTIVHSFFSFRTVYTVGITRWPASLFVYLLYCNISFFMLPDRWRNCGFSSKRSSGIRSDSLSSLQTTKKTRMPPFSSTMKPFYRVVGRSGHLCEKIYSKNWEESLTMTP